MATEKHCSGMRAALLAGALALGCGDGVGHGVSDGSAGSAGDTAVGVPGLAGDALRASGGASGADGKGEPAVAAAGSAGSAGDALRASGGASGGTRRGDAGSGQVTTLPACDIPDAQLLAVIHPEATLGFSVQGALPIQVGMATDLDASRPDEWLEQTSLTLPASGTVKVFARVAHRSCKPVWFEHVYSIAAAYPGPVGDSTTTAIALDDPAIVGWAVGHEALVLGENSTNSDFHDPTLLLGPAEKSSYDVVALGDGGTVTLLFDPPITDGAGWDFAVFENGFSETFLELAYIEVSSDGTTFARFDSAYLGPEPLAAFGRHATTLFEGLGGKYAQGYGNPFDLQLLRFRPEVQRGAVDLGHITHVRIVDITGDGSSEDSFGNPIYDPYPGAETAGFDLDAVAVIHAAS